MIKIMEDPIKIFMTGFKVWKKIHKKSQTDLALVIGKHQTSVAAYLKGTIKPDFSQIQKWVDHYKLDYDEIIETGRQELLGQVPHKGTHDIEDIITKVTERLSFQQPHRPRRSDPLFETYQKLSLLSEVAPAEAQEVKEIIDMKLRKYTPGRKTESG